MAQTTLTAKVAIKLNADGTITIMQKGQRVTCDLDQLMDLIETAL